MSYQQYSSSGRRRWPWLVAGSGVVLVIVASIVLVSRTVSVDPRPVAVPPPQLEARPATSDDAPAGLQLTADPICEDHELVYNILVARWQSFAQIDEAIPASRWTTEQRDVADGTARAMRSAAAQYESMLPQAQNRVIQELLAQVIVYLRATADNLPSYRAVGDVNLAFTATRLDGAIRGICAAVPALSRLSPDVARSLELTEVSVDPRALVPFMQVKDDICHDYVGWAERRDEELKDWELQGGQLDLEETAWTPDQRVIAADAAQVLARNANEVQAFAERAENPLVRDFLATAVPYNEVFAERLPTYRLSDWPLWDVTTYLINAIRFGCQT